MVGREIDEVGGELGRRRCAPGDGGGRGDVERERGRQGAVGGFEREEDARIGIVGIVREREDGAGGRDEVDGAADAVERAVGARLGQVDGSEDGDVVATREIGEAVEQGGRAFGAGLREACEGVEDDDPRVVDGTDGLAEGVEVAGELDGDGVVVVERGGLADTGEDADAREVRAGGREAGDECGLELVVGGEVDCSVGEVGLGEGGVVEEMKQGRGV